ncbi:unnamed protein product, partial [Urochloa humidicola]
CLTSNFTATTRSPVRWSAPSCGGSGTGASSPTSGSRAWMAPSNRWPTRRASSSPWRDAITYLARFLQLDNDDVLSVEAQVLRRFLFAHY